MGGVRYGGKKKQKRGDVLLADAAEIEGRGERRKLGGRLLRVSVARLYLAHMPWVDLKEDPLLSF
jgi:hypothetical protein